MRASARNAADVDNEYRDRLRAIAQGRSVPAMPAPPVRLVVVTVDELRSLIREAVREELASAKPPPVASDVLTRRQVGQLLHVTPHHVSALIRKGMPAIRFGAAGRHWRFRRSEVLAWMASERAPS